jgi:hypothetical protein
MTGPTPSDEGDVRPIRSSDRRWLLVPAALVAFLMLAVAKPWGGERAVTHPSAPPAVAVATVTPTPAASPDAPSPVPLVSLPAAAVVVESIPAATVPWSNEIAADPGGLWWWTDQGVVLHADATTNATTRIEVDRPSTPAFAELGSRGIAVAGSQVWAADPGRRGLARIDPLTGSVAERVELWKADAVGAAGSPPGTATDRWASAWGFAIDGPSIYIPSIMPRLGDVVGPAPGGGEMWRVDPSSGKPPDWLTIDRPTALAVGFGSVWVVSCCGSHSDARTYSIVRLEKDTGGIQATIALPALETQADARPVVRVGPDSVWVGLTDSPLVVRIDPATSSIRSTLPMDLPVSDLAVGDDGSVWVTESEAWYRFGAVVSDRCDGHLVRIDPVSESAVSANTLACPMSVAISGRDVWVGSAGTEGSAIGGTPPSVVHLRATDPPG